MPILLNSIDFLHHDIWMDFNKIFFKTHQYGESDLERIIQNLYWSKLVYAFLWVMTRPLKYHLKLNDQFSRYFRP